MAGDRSSAHASALYGSDKKLQQLSLTDKLHGRPQSAGLRSSTAGMGQPATNASSPRAHSVSSQRTSAGQRRASLDSSTTNLPAGAGPDYTYVTSRKTLTMTNSTIAVAFTEAAASAPPPAYPTRPRSASVTAAAWKAYGSPSARGHPRPVAAPDLMHPNPKSSVIDSFTPRTPTALKLGGGFKLPHRPHTAPARRSLSASAASPGGQGMSTDYIQAPHVLLDTGAVEDAPDMSMPANAPILYTSGRTGKVVRVGKAAGEFSASVQCQNDDIRFAATMPTDPKAKTIWEDLLKRHGVNMGLLTPSGMPTGDGAPGSHPPGSLRRPPRPNSARSERLPSQTIRQVQQQGSEWQPYKVAGFAKPSDELAVPDPDNPCWGYSRLGRSTLARLHATIRMPRPNSAPTYSIRSSTHAWPPLGASHGEMNTPYLGDMPFARGLSEPAPRPPAPAHTEAARQDAKAVADAPDLNVSGSAMHPSEAARRAAKATAARFPSDAYSSSTPVAPAPAGSQPHQEEKHEQVQVADRLPKSEVEVVIPPPAPTPASLPPAPESMHASALVEPPPQLDAPASLKLRQQVEVEQVQQHEEDDGYVQEDAGGSGGEDEVEAVIDRMSQAGKVPAPAASSAEPQSSLLDYLPVGNTSGRSQHAEEPDPDALHALHQGREGVKALSHSSSVQAAAHAELMQELGLPHGGQSQGQGRAGSSEEQQQGAGSTSGRWQDDDSPELGASLDAQQLRDLNRTSTSGLGSSFKSVGEPADTEPAGSPSRSQPARPGGFARPTSARPTSARPMPTSPAAAGPGAGAGGGGAAGRYADSQMGVIPENWGEEDLHEPVPEDDEYEVQEGEEEAEQV
mmetsp:Transcript_14419/g.31214  ORF Transcript_14419/g.31214 Transcript_14419/m.31214 type:complete len:849 (-) Transcript_14419:326-2872(-)